MPFFEEQKNVGVLQNVNEICDADGKLYLYDFIRIKKETRSPLEQ